MTGIQFPMTQDVSLAVNEMVARRLEYVQLSIDVKKEIINLEVKGRCSLKELAKQVPNDHPRYHLFVYRHTYEGDLYNSIGEPEIKAIDHSDPNRLIYFFSVFIYTMPGYNCSIKERMLYSSCKNSVVDRIMDQGLQIEKKVITYHCL